MITKFNQFLNENKDLFPPKTKEEISKDIKELSPNQLLIQLETAIEDDNFNLVKTIINIGFDIPVDFSETLQVCVDNGIDFNDKVIKYLVNAYIKQHKNVDKLRRFAKKNGFEDLVDFLREY